MTYRIIIPNYWPTILNRMMGRNHYAIGRLKKIDANMNEKLKQREAEHNK